MKKQTSTDKLCRVEEKFSGQYLHFSLHSEGTIDKQIARFMGHFARNFVIVGGMIDK